jgi:hypothetical protein
MRGTGVVAIRHAEVPDLLFPALDRGVDGHQIGVVLVRVPARERIAHVPDAVLVSIQLAGIRDRGAVVARVAHAVRVEVRLVRIRPRRAVVGRGAQPISVQVIEGVADAGRALAKIADAVEVRIFLKGILNREAIITGRANAVPVEIGLIVIGNERTVVEPLLNRRPYRNPSSFRPRSTRRRSRRG